MREANEGWARYVQRVVDLEYDGNQSALAQAIGVSPSTVTRWIDGATPTLSALHEIRETLGTPMVELLVAAGALRSDDNGSDVETQDRVVIASVAEAIRHDVGLIEEARQHLLHQYELLLRLAPADRSSPSVAGDKKARGKQIPRRAKGSDEPPLRAVARGGDPTHREEVSRMARRVREQHDHGEGTDKDT